MSMTVTNINHRNNNLQPKQNKEVQGDQKDRKKCKHQKVNHWTVLLGAICIFMYFCLTGCPNHFEIEQATYVEFSWLAPQCTAMISRSLEDQPDCSQRNVRNQDRLVQRYMVPCPPRPSSLLQKNVCKVGAAVPWKLRISTGFPCFSLAVAANKTSPLNPFASSRSWQRIYILQCAGLLVFAWLHSTPNTSWILSLSL